MRRILAILSAVVLLQAAVGGAAAGRAFKETEHVQDVGCFAETQAYSADFYARLSDRYPTDAYLDVWDGDPYASEPVFMRDYERDVTMSFGANVAISIPVLPSGEALVTGTTDPIGPFDFDDTFKDGNQQYRSSGTGTALAFEGTLTLPNGAQLPLTADQCWSSDLVTSTFFNSPHARVASWSSNDGFCSLTNGDGDTADVFFAVEGGTDLYVDAWVQPSSGAPVGMWGVGPISGGLATVALEEYDPDTGDPTGYPASAEVQLTEGDDDIDYVLKASNWTGRVTGSLVDVAGSLDTSAGAFDLDPCVIAVTRTKDILTPSNGPKPGGKRPANDLPSGAIALRSGSKATVATKGAQQASEVAYPCMSFTDFDGTVYTVPVEHTVWYRVAGTGRDITIDTAGSDFDTVMAVYANGPDAAATVDCVDDVAVVPFGRTLQASITLPTTAIGTTYWVQIGGYQEGSGIVVPYGNLKVAVR